MQESHQNIENEEPSYWTSVGVAGVTFGLLLFILSLIAAYVAINSEPSGSFFTPTQILSYLTCLIGIFGGMLAVWHYTSMYNITITLGRGALIGFLTGVCITVVNMALSQLWEFVDPDMTQQLIDSLVANYEAMELPDAQRQLLIDSTVQQMREGNFFSQLIKGAPLNGILNLFTGMIGAKVFGKKEI